MQVVVEVVVVVDKTGKAYIERTIIDRDMGDVAFCRYTNEGCYRLIKKILRISVNPVNPVM